MRWRWIGLAIVSTVGYLWINPLITIVRLQDEEEEGQAELERDEESENQRIWPWQIQVDD